VSRENPVCYAFFVFFRQFAKDDSQRVFLLLCEVNLFSLGIDVEQKNRDLLTTVEDREMAKIASPFSLFSVLWLL
jgi:hypothetical protein